MDWVLSALIVLINYLLSKKNKWGWVIATFNNFAWIYYALYYLNPPQYGLVPSAILNLFVSINGVIIWFEIDTKKYINNFRSFLQSIWDISGNSNL